MQIPEVTFTAPQVLDGSLLWTKLRWLVAHSAKSHSDPYCLLAMLKVRF